MKIYILLLPNYQVSRLVEAWLPTVASGYIHLRRSERVGYTEVETSSYYVFSVARHYRGAQIIDYQKEVEVKE